MTRHNSEDIRLPLSERLLPLASVRAMTGLSKSTIYRLVATGDLPPPIRVSQGRVAWCESDLQAWIVKKRAK